MNLRGAGVLRERVVIQSKTTTADTQGGRAVAWGTLATVWAAVTPMRATEVLAAQSIGSQATYAVEMAYRTDVTPSMRVVWTPYRGSSKTLEVAGVQMVAGQPVRMVLSCGEVI